MNTSDKKMIIDAYALCRRRELAGADERPLLLPNAEQARKIEACIMEAAKKMTPLECYTLQGRIDGLSTEQMAAHANYTPGYICQVLNAAVQKIDFSTLMGGRNS